MEKRILILYSEKKIEIDLRRQFVLKNNKMENIN